MAEVIPEWLQPLGPLFTLGQTAPAFELAVASWPADRGASPDSLSLAELADRVVILDFWNSGCIPCIVEHEALNAVATRYAPRGVAFVGISAVDSPESLERFADRFGAFSYPNLMDPAGEVSRRYNARGVPTKVVIDRSGRVVWWRPGGPIAEEVLVGVLEDVLAGRPPGAPQAGTWDEAPTPR